MPYVAAGHRAQIWAIFIFFKFARNPWLAANYQQSTWLDATHKSTLGFLQDTALDEKLEWLL